MYQVRVWRLLRKLNPDVVHFHDPELLPPMLALTFIDGRVRVVYDVHENVESTLRSSLVRWLYRGLLSMAERRMNLILAEESYRKFCDRPWPILRNLGLDFGAHSRDTRRRQMVYVGDVAEERGALVMLKAFISTGLKDWDLVYIGKCNETGLTETLEREARGQGVEGRFHRLGYLSLDKAMCYVKESSLGLAIIHPIPNHIQSLPTKIFDYLSAAVPVLVSDFPFYRNFFSDIPGIRFVDPLDVNAVAMALSEMAKRKDEWVSRAEAGRRIFLERYSWSKERENLLKAYAHFSERKNVE